MSLHLERATAIHRGARHVLGDWGPEWINTPNPRFGNRAPSVLMTIGEWQPLVDELYRCESVRAARQAAIDLALAHKMARLGRAARDASTVFDAWTDSPASPPRHRS